MSKITIQIENEHGTKHLETVLKLATDLIGTATVVEDLTRTSCKLCKSTLVDSLGKSDTCADCADKIAHGNTKVEPLPVIKAGYVGRIQDMESTLFVSRNEWSGIMEIIRSFESTTGRG